MRVRQSLSARGGVRSLSSRCLRAAYTYIHSQAVSDKCTVCRSPIKRGSQCALFSALTFRIKDARLGLAEHPTTDAMVGNLKLSTSSQCIKYLMFIFNLLFVITGIILLSIGSVIHGVYKSYSHFLDDRFLSVPSLLIAVGCIIFFIAFFGCCGAVRENYCMIVTFTALMVIVFILELSAGISGYVLRSSAQEVIKKEMLKTMDNYNNTDLSLSTAQIWDDMQRGLECCGTDGPADWNGHFETNQDDVPMSCCKQIYGTVGNSTCKVGSKDINKMGCLNAFALIIQGHAVQLGGAGIGIAFVQALGIWFSVYLARSIKRSYENM